MKTKICLNCFNKFEDNSRSHNRTKCSSCKKIVDGKRSKEYNREYYIKYVKSYRIKNAESEKNKRKEYYHNGKGKSNSLKRNFGISIEEYNKLLENQGRCCAICGKNQSGFRKSLVVDHDHITGKIRGLLCNNCNVLLGYSLDNVDILYKSIQYLQKQKGELDGA